MVSELCLLLRAEDGWYNYIYGLVHANCGLVLVMYSAFEAAFVCHNYVFRGGIDPNVQQ